MKKRILGKFGFFTGLEIDSSPYSRELVNIILFRDELNSKNLWKMEDFSEIGFCNHFEQEVRKLPVRK